MKTVATIPMAGDLAELIGRVAERVENRSLLLDKFVFHKNWGLHEIKANDAHRWSLLRIAEGGDFEIAREAKRRSDEADRLEQKGQNPGKVQKLRIEAKLAEELAGTAKPPGDLADLRARHTRRFIGLFRSAFGSRAVVTIGQLEGRLAINLADSLIQNAGICLDRLFGLPYIPGSAVKGVCRHAALAELKTSEGPQQAELFQVFCAVFGTAENDFTKGDLARFRRLMPREGKDQKGAVSFLPAYPVNEARVVVDLTNVHYPDYYRRGRLEDLSKERPQPNPFPAVEAGAQFAFCLVLNGMNDDPKLIDHARRWLEKALTEQGVGAKTASGYGWFSLKPEVLEAIEEQERQEAKAAAARAREAQEKAERERREKERLASLSPEEKAAEELKKLSDEQFALFARAIGEKDEIQQRAFIQLLRDDKEKRQRWKTWKKKKPDLANGIREVCKKLNLPDLP